MITTASRARLSRVADQLRHPVRRPAVVPVCTTSLTWYDPPADVEGCLEPSHPAGRYKTPIEVEAQAADLPRARQGVGPRAVKDHFRLHGRPVPLRRQGQHARRPMRATATGVPASAAGEDTIPWLQSQIEAASPARRWPARWPLRCDVLVDVKEVARIVGTLDLDQAVVVLAVVVLDFVVIVVLHEVDVTAGLCVRG